MGKDVSMTTIINRFSYVDIMVLAFIGSHHHGNRFLLLIIETHGRDAGLGAHPTQLRRIRMMATCKHVRSFITHSTCGKALTYVAFSPALVI